MSTYMEIALKAVKEAEKIVMSYFNQEKNIRFKREVDPVTQADIESEKKIVEIISKAFPKHGFILEEDDNILEDADYRWIIDPIDGTTSFSHNYPFFCISIALYKKKTPLLGVIKAPYLNELFTAEIGKGAFLNNEKITVSNIRTVKEGLIATGFPYTRLSSNKDNLNYFNKIAKKAGGLRRDGSAALDVCYVACGRCDAYWEQELKIMDVAAAVIILKEANGRITDIFGKKIDDNFTNILATNGKLHNEMLKILRSAE